MRLAKLQRELAYVMDVELVIRASFDILIKDLLKCVNKVIYINSV